MDQLNMCEENLKLQLFANHMDSVVEHCEDKKDILLLASLLMTYVQKLYAIGMNNEDLGNSLIFDYIVRKMGQPRTPKVTH